MHIFEVSRPLDVVAVRDLDLFFDLGIGFGDKGGDIAPLYLHRDHHIATQILTLDKGRPLNHLDITHLIKPDYLAAFAAQQH